MSKDKQRRNRRSYLDQFTPNEDGSYTYKGVCYRRDASYTPVILWSAVAFLAAVASGLFPYEPMMNTIYVILPFLGEVTVGGFLLWGAIRVAYHGQVLREYVYEKTAARVNALSITMVVFSLLGAIWNLVYLILCSFQVDTLFTVLFFLCKIFATAAVLMARRGAGEIQWEKVAPGKATALDD